MPLAPRLVLATALLTGSLVSARAQPTAAPPLSTKVDALQEQGRAHFNAGNYAAAMAAYKQAYAIEPRSGFLFSMAAIEYARGDCAAAISLYKRFLETKPGPESTRLSNDAITTCQQRLAASGASAVPDQPLEQPEPAEPSKPEPTPATPLPAAPATRTVTRPFYTDVLGDLLVGAGVVGLGTGGTFYLLARRDVDRANQGGGGGVPLEEYERLKARAEDRQLYAAVAGGVGAALVVGGVVRYLTGDRTETIEVRPSVGADGASVTLGLRF